MEALEILAILMILTIFAVVTVGFASTVSGWHEKQIMDDEEGVFPAIFAGAFYFAFGVAWCVCLYVLVPLLINAVVELGAYFR